jgi:plasmid stabilization system protein ParE
VIRTDAAQRDIGGVLAWLDERSPAAADRLAASIDDVGRLLGGQPRMGRSRDDLCHGLRSVVVGQ